MANIYFLTSPYKINRTEHESISPYCNITLININFCIGSTHSNKTMLDCSAPQRYLWPVEGFLTAKKGETEYISVLSKYKL